MMNLYTFVTTFAAVALLHFPAVAAPAQDDASRDAGKPVAIVSPDGKLSVTVETDGGVPVYSVSYGGKVMIGQSPLGFTSNEGDFSRDMSIASSSCFSKEYTYTQDKIKKSCVGVRASGCIVTFAGPEGREMSVEWHVADNDAAFRYLIPRQGGTGSMVISSEATSFRFPEGTTTFLTPQSDAMIGWMRTKPSYEEFYTADAPMDAPSQYGHGYTFPALFKVGDSGWVLLSESGVDGYYCGSRLSDFHDGLYTIAYPMPEENNGNGSASPGIALPGKTPWRTITVGATLAPIVETTIPWDVVEPLYGTSRPARPGKGTWSWILWQDGSINYDDQKTYIDFAAQMGYSNVLVDNWWDRTIGREGMASLAEYARSLGVNLTVWYSSSGHWNDISQSPVNRMDRPIVRKKEMEWLRSIGVGTIKVDFFGGDKQETMRLYEDILSDAADYGIDVIFHGCTMPRGWERMYPNYVGSEAVLASENLIFGQQFCDLEAFSACLHPFIRNSVGIMEFGGTFLNRRMSRDNSSGNVRRTGDAFELATAVLFQNPVQNFALAPNNLEDAPAEAIGFMKDVPVVWDDVRFIGGYPGKSVVLARRSGDLWYVAGINAEETDLDVVFDPSLIGADAEDADARLYVDDSVESMRVCTPGLRARRRRDPRTLSLTLPQNCGFVLVMKAAGAAD